MHLLQRLQNSALILAASALLVALVLPDFVYPYMFDDYDFLARVLPFRIGSLLPSPDVVFYRPLSREIYFGILQTLSPHSAILGHLGNMGLALAAAMLVFGIGATVWGKREGFYAAVLFAGFAHLPFLVAWVSGVQDLLAIVFALAALLFELRRKHILALVCFGLALLSKETAIAWLPALILAPRASQARRPLTLKEAADYLIVCVLWAAIHPGVHSLLRGGTSVTLGGYIGLNPARLVEHVGLYLGSLTNLPILNLNGPWPPGLTACAVTASVILIAAAWIVPRREEGGEPNTGLTHAAPIFLLTVASPILLIAALVKQWAPYYVVVAAPGCALLCSTFFARLPRALATALLAGYVVIGVWTRGMPVGSSIPTEWSMAPTASALTKVERELRSLVPSVDSTAQVLVLVMDGPQSILGIHFGRLQVMRQWYRLPDLRIRSPELREPAPGPDLPLWISRSHRVFRLNPVSLRIHAATTGLSIEELEGFITAYAFGLSESGKLGPAVRAVTGLPARDERSREGHLRVAAGLLIAHGFERHAEELLQPLLPANPAWALDVLAKTLQWSSGRRAYEKPFLRAFSLSDRDPSTVRQLMNRLNASHAPATVHAALLMLELAPGDPQAAAILRETSPKGPAPAVVPHQDLR